MDVKNVYVTNFVVSWYLHIGTTVYQVTYKLIKALKKKVKKKLNVIAFFWYLMKIRLKLNFMVDFETSVEKQINSNKKKLLNPFFQDPKVLLLGTVTYL